MEKKQCAAAQVAYWNKKEKVGKIDKTTKFFSLMVASDEFVSKGLCIS